ncbi:MAG TPA: APC family permease, partial [Lacipirellulaceae bacterium]|nr:APC family permease [Lacipirellulaceae bacterium]
MSGSDTRPKHENRPPVLRRELGVFGATMMGLGSIIGSGVFVSLGIAAGIADAGVIFAIVAAAAVATCNALSSAQLAASHPVSGGTYEYGYRYLNSWLGFSAGWMFLCAKTASAGTAALGFAGYLLNFVGQRGDWLVPLAISTMAALTIIVLLGVRLSSRVNVAIVSITLVALAAFVVGGAPAVSASRLQFAIEPFDLLHATALMFVAYTGYGRIATLGEEVREPAMTIPRAIIITLV